MKFKFVALILLAALVFVPLGSAAASGPQFDGQVIFGQSYTLASGETLTGDLLVFGGAAEIQEGAVVKGNIVLFGGALTVDGEVTGDVSATGATVTIGPSAHIGGDLITIGATLDKADTAQVDGQVYNTATSWEGVNQVETPEPTEPSELPEPQQPVVPNFRFDFGILGNIMNTIWQSLGLAGLAMLVMLFLAPHAERVARAAVSQPLIAGGIGLLTVIVAPIALVMLVVTIFLIPVALIAVVALAVAALFGWIAIGLEVGQRLTKAFHWDWHPAFSAGLGVLILSLASAALTGIPGLNCVGWVIPVAVGLAAFGAVVMTRFGTQSVAVQVEKAAEVPPPPDAGGHNPA